MFDRIASHGESRLSNPKPVFTFGVTAKGIVLRRAAAVECWSDEFTHEGRQVHVFEVLWIRGAMKARRCELSREHP